jgi:serine/threonine-protein kinase
MSRLFLATESSLGRKVVIKMLPPDTASEVSAARFQREVQLAAQLQHPNILPVLSIGSSGEGLYYVMPFVAGESLRHRLESGDRFPIHEALRVLREIADALALAHGRGIVFRDIKPSNILLQEGHAVLTDWHRASGRGSAAGRYRAPHRDGVGRHARLWRWSSWRARRGWTRAPTCASPSSGTRCWREAAVLAADHAGARRRAHRAAAALSEVAPDVPPVICVIIEKVLAKSPDDRYRTAAEFRDAPTSR